MQLFYYYNIESNDQYVCLLKLIQSGDLIVNYTYNNIIYIE